MQRTLWCARATFARDDLQQRSTWNTVSALAGPKLFHREADCQTDVCLGDEHLLAAAPSLDRGWVWWNRAMLTPFAVCSSLTHIAHKRLRVGGGWKEKMRDWCIGLALGGLGMTPECGVLRCLKSSVICLCLLERAHLSCFSGLCIHTPHGFGIAQDKWVLYSRHDNIIDVLPKGRNPSRKSWEIAG